MRKLVGTIVLLSALVLTASALAGVTKYTFNEVTYPDGTTGEIEAGVKDTNRSDLTNCSYFSDDYQQALGYYADAVVFTTAEEVRQFCLDHFDERWQ
jgi:hypothetical protein